ncbi:MAG: nucleoside deaminase [Saprospiraceae bacterium]
MLEPFDDKYFMKQALIEAKKAYEVGEVPIGAVVVCDNRIIARAHNNTEQLCDVTAHAEMVAITAACNGLGNKYLNECTLYVTIEPCTMCAGASAWAQMGRVVYGAGDDKGGFMRFGKKMLHPRTAVSFGVMEAECRELMQSFFLARRGRS